MKTLVIVESPNKVKSIKGYLGNDYLVSASVGHIRDLKATELAVDVNNNFAESFEVSKDKVNVVKQLQDMAKKADLILLATDPDREGEAISWHLEYVLKRHNKNIKRVTFNEITKTAVQKAIQSGVRGIDHNTVNAQRTRRILDRLVGYLVSGLLQNKIEGNLSAGRVQSAVVRLIKDRDEEIKNFVPQEYWNLFAHLTKQGQADEFRVKLAKKNDENIKINNKEEYDQIINDLNNAQYIVDKIEAKSEKKKPDAPLITSSLQKQSYSLFKYDSETTMKIAQQLFEGIEVNGDRSGLITYMRTDSYSVSEDFRKVTYDYIDNQYGAKYIPPTPNKFANKGNAQEAHECIRPTHIEYEPDKIKQFLTKQQYDVYSLIYHRYYRSQMAHAEYDTLNVEIKANEYLFKEKGSSLKFDGYLIHDKLGGNNSKDKLLPQLSESEILDLQNLDGEQKFTQPPSLFDEGTLIETLEKMGIGRPSTYASIIKLIKARGYVALTKKNGKDYFDITDLGRKVVDELINYFSNLFNLDYTKQMEDFLDDVETGKANFIDVLDNFYKDFKKELDGAYLNMPVQKEMNYFDKPCPKCGNKLIVKKGKFGEYLECEKFPVCDTRMNKETVNVELSNIICPSCGEHKLAIRTNKQKQKFYTCENEACKALPYYEEKDIHPEPCDKCGNPMILRTSTNGKFYSCLGYYIAEPQCKHTKPFIDPKNSKDCDKCGKPMILRKGKNGQFWACSGYPDCSNTAPYVDPKNSKTCDKCGKPMVKRSGANGEFWACTGYPDCRNTEPVGKKKTTAKKSGEKCDKCGKEMVIRNGANGKFLACSGYPDCRNSKPYKE